MNDFEIDINAENSEGKIGLDENGQLWFSSCCDAANVQLDVRQALKLRNVVNTFLSKNGAHRS